MDLFRRFLCENPQSINKYAQQGPSGTYFHATQLCQRAEETWFRDEKAEEVNAASKIVRLEVTFNVAMENWMVRLVCVNNSVTFAMCKKCAAPPSGKRAGS